MSDARPTCCHCRLPIHPGSTGLRHYGLYTAHSENECTRLLHAEIDRLKLELDVALAHAAGTAKDFDRLQASRDAAAAQARAAAADAARAWGLYLDLRVRLRDVLDAPITPAEAQQEQPR